MLDCLEHMEEYDPVGAVDAEKRIWQEFADAAEVSVEVLKQAYSRVVSDGYYGPFNDEDWEECNGYIMPMARAERIMHDALLASIYITYQHPDCGYVCEGGDECNHPDHQELEDDGPLSHCEYITIDMESIRRSCFGKIKTIYGGWL